MTQQWIFKFLAVASLTTAMVAQADPVMLRFKGKDGKETVLKASHFEKLRKKLPENMAKLDKDRVLTALRDQELAALLLKDAAKSAGLETDPKVKEMAAKLLESAIVSVYMERKVEGKLTPAARQALYQEVVTPLRNQKMYDISIIQVKDEVAGKSIIQQLDTGKDFGTLARMHSLNKQTAEQGGKVGALPEMVLTQAFGPEVFKVVATLKDGKYSKMVFKNKENKFFVIKVNGSRMAKIPTMEEVQDQLDDVLAKKALVEIIMDLKNAAEKERRFSTFDDKGKPQAPLSLTPPQATAGA